MQRSTEYESKVGGAVLFMSMRTFMSATFWHQFDPLQLGAGTDTGSIVVLALILLLFPTPILLLWSKFPNRGEQYAVPASCLVLGVALAAQTSARAHSVLTGVALLLALCSTLHESFAPSRRHKYYVIDEWALRVVGGALLLAAFNALGSGVNALVATPAFGATCLLLTGVLMTVHIVVEQRVYASATTKAVADAKATNEADAMSRKQRIRALLVRYALYSPLLGVALGSFLVLGAAIGTNFSVAMRLGAASVYVFPWLAPLLIVAGALATEALRVFLHDHHGSAPYHGACVGIGAILFILWPLTIAFHFFVPPHTLGATCYALLTYPSVRLLRTALQSRRVCMPVTVISSGLCTLLYLLALITSVYGGEGVFMPFTLFNSVRELLTIACCAFYALSAMLALAAGPIQVASQARTNHVELFHDDGDDDGEARAHDATGAPAVVGAVSESLELFSPNDGKVRALVLIIFLVLFSVLCTAIGSWPPSVRFDDGTATDAEMRANFTVSTFNIQEGYSRSGTLNTARVVSQLETTGSDVIALQETDSTHLFFGARDIVRAISTGLRMASLYGMGTLNATEGVAMLWAPSLPIIDYRVSDLNGLANTSPYCVSDQSPRCPLARRQLVHAEAHLNGVSVHVISTHLADHPEALQTEQIDSIVGYANRYIPHDSPLIIMGDLNVTPTSPLLASLIYGLRLQSAVNNVKTAGPYPSEMQTEPVQIDYILYRYMTLIDGALVDAEERDADVSDHRAIRATFAWPFHEAPDS